MPSLVFKKITVDWYPTTEASNLVLYPTELPGRAAGILANMGRLSPADIDQSYDCSSIEPCYTA
jgi:hypothetical protein